MEITGISNLET